MRIGMEYNNASTFTFGAKRPKTKNNPTENIRPVTWLMRSMKESVSSMKSSPLWAKPQVHH